jgi:hypothetical protein
MRADLGRYGDGIFFIPPMFLTSDKHSMHLMEMIRLSTNFGIQGTTAVASRAITQSWGRPIRTNAFHPSCENSNIGTRIGYALEMQPLDCLEG